MKKNHQLDYLWKEKKTPYIVVCFIINAVKIGKDYALDQTKNKCKYLWILYKYYFIT